MIKIRLLATTDLHGHLLPFDYIKDQPTQGDGLAGLARLIAEERARADAQGVPVILVDNGDTFQGNPLANRLAHQKVRCDHPIVACMNHLAYDVAGLGNHDLDHGLPYLKAVAGALEMPLLNSNLEGVDIAPLKKSVLLHVDVGDQAAGALTLGVISVLPQQSAAWNKQHLGDGAIANDPAQTVIDTSKDLRAAGADLIVVLAHMGVGLRDGDNSDSRASHALVETGCVDAVILGHTHRRLPSVDYAKRDGVDIHKSTVGGVPALMAGHAGSDLGVMDLTLEHDADTGWRVAMHHCVLRPNGANVLADPPIAALAQTEHDRVRGALRQRITKTARTLHSFFSTACPAPTQHLTALSYYNVVNAALAGTAHEQVPVLATAAAHGAGGRDGLGNYIHIPKGDVLARHMAGLNPFENQVVGISVTGAQLHEWLEHSASLFNTLLPTKPNQFLANPDIPAFQFDTIFGLNYLIDPTQKPYARISALTYAGAPVRDDQQFILATNQFRASGGGGYLPTPKDRIVATLDTSIEATMTEILQSGTPAPWGNTAPWAFAPPTPTQALIYTHPDAMEQIADIRHLKPTLQGSTPDGFIRISLTL